MTFRIWLAGFFSVALLFSHSAYSQDSAKPMKIIYGSNNWNSSPTSIDNAFLFIRDKKSGKIVKVLLDETAPDSSTFSGSFFLGWGNMKGNRPEVYIPPQNLRGADGLKKFKTMLSQGKLSRKPTVFRDLDREQSFDVYDTKEQAQKGLEIAKKEKQMRNQRNQAKKLLENLDHTKDALGTSQLAEEMEKKKAADLMANQQEAERLRLEQLERQKALERLKKQRQASDKERKRRKAEAEKLGKQGMAKFTKGDFPGASELFTQALDLDPDNKTYALNYAIALYRQKLYNKSLVILKIVPDEAERLTEKQYYYGLSYFNAKESKNALPYLKYVKKQKHKDFSPSAAFYIGLIHMQTKKYNLAKENFEHVIDTSSDPKMDASAEKYIETIASLQKWEKKREKPFTLVGMLGLQYDSNVLLTPDGIDSSGSQEGDIRGTLMAQLQYRAIFQKKHEWVPQVMTYYQYSSKDSVSSADVFLNSVALPYTYKGKLFGKGYKMIAKPAYEIINMDINKDGTREVILNGIVANIDNTFVMSQKWFASYILEARQDDSQLTSGTDDNADATKFTLKNKNINFLDKKKKKILMSHAAVALNNATGKNKNYTKIELGAKFLKPIYWWKSTWNIGLTIYQQNYSDTSTNRKDLNANLSTGISRPINDWLNLSIAAAYTNNDSNVATNEYNKYTLTTNLISKLDF